MLVKSKPLQPVLMIMHIRLRLSMPDPLSAISNETELVLGQHVTHVCDDARCQLAKSLARYLKGSTNLLECQAPNGCHRHQDNFSAASFHS